MNEKALAVDTEISTSNKGNPYDQTNELVCYSWSNGKRSLAVRPADLEFDDFRRAVDDSDCLVLFNAKFDLAWLRRTEIEFEGKRIWDVQLAEYMLERQQIKYPSLEDTAVKYKLGHKIDVIKEEYWKKGIDTRDIPWEVLQPYAIEDARLTYEAYLRQVEQFKSRPKLFTLFQLACADLLILLEMEWNGLKYDEEVALTEETKLKQQIEELEKKLHAVYPDVNINFGSNDQLSCFLYGGTIKETVKEMQGFYKTGKRAGEPKFGNKVIEHQLPRLFEPIKGSELSKEGFYGTSEDLLKKLSTTKKTRWIIETLLELAKLTKLVSTYYTGLITLNHKMNWHSQYLHGQYNQCVTRTGRLSSSSPNMQNLSGASLSMFVSRYED